MTGSEERRYAVDEAAARLGLSRAEVYRRVKDGALKAEKVERLLVLAEAELQRYEDTTREQAHARDVALDEWLAFFGARLAARGGQDGSAGARSPAAASPATVPPPAGAEPAAAGAEPPTPEARVAELGGLLLLDALLDGVPDAHLDPLQEGARWLSGAEGNRREVARFPAALSTPLREWLLKLAPLPAEGVARAALGHREHGGEAYPFRLAAVPTRLGEHLHLHFFAPAPGDGLQALGYGAAQAEALQPLLSGRPGLLVVCGPRGPAADDHWRGLARYLKAPGRLVVSLEHRVQPRDEELVQLDLAGVDAAAFTDLWGSALDMGPEVLLVDEVAHAAGARGLIEGAASGALVVARVRGGSALTALRGLLALEVDPAALACNLLGLVERRALRRLCPACRRTRPCTAEEAELLGVEPGVPVPVAGSCNACGDGFAGRRAVYGVWPADEGLATWIRDLSTPPPAVPGELGLPGAGRAAVLEGEGLVEDVRALLAGARAPGVSGNGG